MSPDRERRLEEVFSAARDLPARERAAFLERACECDAELRSQADSLLAAHEQAGDFLDHTIPLPAPDFLIERTGTMIGRYKLLEKIGEGGFGGLSRRVSQFRCCDFHCQSGRRSVRKRPWPGHGKAC